MRTLSLAAHALALVLAAGSLAPAALAADAPEALSAAAAAGTVTGYVGSQRGAIAHATVIATRTDGGVSFAHAQSLASAIRNAQLVESRADTHFVWIGPDWPAIGSQIRRFLEPDPHTLL